MSNGVHYSNKYRAVNDLKKKINWNTISKINLKATCVDSLLYKPKSKGCILPDYSEIELIKGKENENLIPSLSEPAYEENKFNKSYEVQNDEGSITRNNKSLSKGKMGELIRNYRNKFIIINKPLLSRTKHDEDLTKQKSIHSTY